MSEEQVQNGDECRNCGGIIDYAHHDKGGMRYTWRACTVCKTVYPIIKRENGEVVAYIRCLERNIPKEELLGVMVESGEHDEELTSEEPEPKKKGKVEAIKDLLLSGHTRKDIAKMKHEPTGETYNVGSIRIAASDLKKDRLWDPSDEEGVKFPAEVGNGRGSHHVAVSTKASPPEAIIDSFEIPMAGSPDFEKGMKFGMGTLVMAVRVMQELAQVGAMQAKPLINLSREMRAGEEAAAKTAAQDAALLAGKEFFGIIGPYLEKIDAMSVRETSIVPADTPGTNPMMNMMMRAMEPMLKGTMDGVMKKLMPGVEVDSTPSSWTREKRP